MTGGVGAGASAGGKSAGRDTWAGSSGAPIDWLRITEGVHDPNYFYADRQTAMGVVTTSNTMGEALGGYVYSMPTVTVADAPPGSYTYTGANLMSLMSSSNLAHGN